MSVIAGLRKSLFLVLLCICFFIVKAQDEASIRKIITEADIKKLLKADEIKQQADNFIEEANQLNMEVFTVQSDPNLDEKAKSKKVTQLENQAQQKHLDAAVLYEKCNETKFSIYKKYIDEFWKKHEGQESDYLNSKLLEEQSSDNYFQAVSYRIEARKMDGFAKVEKLTEANDLENQALQKQFSALGVYYGIADAGLTENINTEQPDISTEEPQEANVISTDNINADTSGPVITQQSIPQFASNDKTLPDNITLNQSMVDSYNRYISTGQFNDTTLSTGEIAGVTTFDRDNLLRLWYEYIYGRNQDFGNSDLTDASDTLQSADSNLVSVIEKTPEKGNKEIGIVTDENIGTLIPADENVIFRVQVAANRSELSQRALSKMYYGNKSVEMINENGWYKYSVGDFDTYDEANKFRKSSGISNAFVVAYRKGTRFAPGGQKEQEQASQVIYTPGAGDNKLPSGLIFRIQVAASRVPLTPGQLNRIYNGGYPVEMISEDGWYKYQFMGVRLYSDAIQLIKNVTTNGAFIVAYDNGAKMDLAEAVRNNKELEKEVKTYGRKGHIQEIEFHLQIAASRAAIPPAEMQSLYKGAESISVIYEDGWYKYHLKAGNSPEMAENFRNTCNVPKAFIVAYKKAAKINIYQAIQELK